MRDDNIFLLLQYAFKAWCSQVKFVSIINYII